MSGNCRQATCPMRQESEPLIGSMGGSSELAAVALKACQFVMQESMPNLKQRKQRVIDAAKKLASADSTAEMGSVLDDHLPLLDIFFPLMSKASFSQRACG